MPKQEYVCWECDSHFTVSFQKGSTVEYCPFCGCEVTEDDANEIEENLD